MPDEEVPVLIVGGSRVGLTTAMLLGPPRSTVVVGGVP
jgi:2-polyprenyl-6-methoxyphenol hydroxylase-like FAD-dependent oxidoreductase